MLRYNLTLKDISLFSLFLLFIFSINITSEYLKYREFKSKNFIEIKAIVLNQYKKTRGNNFYFVLKLKTQNFIFYTTTWDNLKDIKELKISLKLIPKKIENFNFFKYLSGFYAFSFDIKLLREKNLKFKISEFIKNQHKSLLLQEFFSAIFLGTTISKNLREVVSAFGVSHLIAISGYHIGVLSLFLFFIISFVYKFFQNRYFPYRNRFIDISFMVFIILLLYLFLTGFIPSLVRAFVMAIVGFFLLIRAVKIISFFNLFLTILIIITFFPKIIFSIGFWFSVSGVFFIFLFLHHLKELNRYFTKISINFFLFFAMLPLSYFVFNQYSIYQILAPFLSIAFVAFYPLEIILHIFNFGDLFDKPLLWLLNLEINLKEIQVSIYFIIFYILFAILSIYKRFIFYIFNLVIITFYLKNIL